MSPLTHSAGGTIALLSRDQLQPKLHGRILQNQSPHGDSRGNVVRVADVNDRPNVAGEGINTAQESVFLHDWEKLSKPTLLEILNQLDLQFADDIKFRELRDAFEKELGTDSPQQTSNGGSNYAKFS